MSLTGSDDLVKAASEAVKSCLRAYGSAATDVDWPWHASVKAHTADDEENREEPMHYLLPTLEGLSSFLQVSLLDDFDPVDVFVPLDRVVSDLEAIVNLASEGFSLHPYLRVPSVDTDFVETASKFISAVALLSRSEGPLLDALKGTGKYESWLDSLSDATKAAISVLSECADPGKVEQAYWAATRTLEYGTPTSDLRHTYFSLCAISGIADILINRGSSIPIPLPPLEEEKLKRLLVDGLRGFFELYDDANHQYVENPASQAGEMIPTCFALEAILKGWTYAPDELRMQARQSLLALAQMIGKRGDGLRAFDKRATVLYLADAQEQFVNLLDDHTTIGTVALVLSLGLNALLVTDISDEYYEALDATVSELLDRRDPNTNIWREGENSIWYTTRAVEALVRYIENRPVQKTDMSVRKLVGIVNSALQSSQVVEAISAEIRKSLFGRK